MALRLFEHDEKAYHAAVRMMEQYGKVAIVHPTGTGKSYIAFKLIEDNPEKVVIWLSPSEYIFKTQLESLKRNDPDFPLVNVHFYTYAKLMCCTQAQLDEIAAQKPAYIILDEFHRAGAECWGESTVALLKLCPEAKLLGLTATNIRYLDYIRDMAEELFDGRVASDMTLGEAIVRGILPAPNYVTTVYQYQKDLARYQTRVDNLHSPGIQDVNQKYLDALRRALEQAGAGQIRIFAKIESLAGVQALPEFLPLVDEVVIARGDLGNAMPLWELPRCQKQLSAVCRSAGVPFMVVTQMLDSMCTRAVPTRAEVSDIYNAVLDGASSLMLTGETAAGQYTVEAMEYLVRTARTALEKPKVKDTLAICCAAFSPEVFRQWKW